MKILLPVAFFTALLFTFSSDASDLLRGRTVYERNCATCHGGYGKGDGPRAETFNPKPVDFTDSAVMATISPERFERAIVLGLPHVAEHRFGHLLMPEEVRDVTAYVRSLVR